MIVSMTFATNSEEFVQSNPEIKISEARWLVEQHGHDFDEFARDCPDASREGNAFIWIDTQKLVDWLGY